MIFKLFWALRAILYKFFFKKFGSFSYIGKPLFLLGTKKISIGKKVRIFPNVRMEAFHNGFINIEDNVSIAQNFHIISGSDQNLIISKNTTISANVFITNIDHQFQELNLHIMNQPLLSNNTFIGENCFIGYGAVIQAGTILGKQCIVGSNAVVRGIFPNYCVIVGMPARIVRRYNPETQLWEKTDNKGNFII